MTPIELHRLAGAIATLHPGWPAASLQTFLERHFTHRPLRDIAVALTFVACDPDTTSPGRVLEAGPWWSTAATRDVPAVPNNCPQHQLANVHLDPVTGSRTCAGCHVDRRADDTATARFDRRPPTDQARRLAGTARATSSDATSGDRRASS
jgi:hypothetical protein